MNVAGFIVVPPVAVAIFLVARTKSSADEMPDTEARADGTQARYNHRSTQLS
jgi:hypothetical protein